ncbi:MAG: phosphatase PAP2 family protein [Xanthobacteraceae bacterium]
MSKTSDAVGLQAVSLLKRIDRLLMFRDFGAVARYNMTIAWLSIACVALVDAIWLPLSRLKFASNNWKLIFTVLLIFVAALLFCAFVTWRLRDSTDRVGAFLRVCIKRVDILLATMIVVAFCGLLGVIYCYLATSAALPLQDGFLAAIDRALGFDWLTFLHTTNTDAGIARLLVAAYKSSEVMLLFTILWLSACGQGERVSEFLALLCLTSAGVAAGLIAVPAAGAYAFYKPLAAEFSNFSADAGMYHYPLFTALRSAAAPAIDFAVPNGVVTFPSFHTVLGIIITYALRGTRWIFVPALGINGLMLVSTLPEGGHHLIDLFAGAAIAVVAIVVVQLPAWKARMRTQTPAPSLGGVTVT